MLIVVSLALNTSYDKILTQLKISDSIPCRASLKIIPTLECSRFIIIKD